MDFETTWTLVDLPGFRTHEHIATYCENSYEDLPPVPDDIDEKFSWLSPQLEDQKMGGNLQILVEMAQQQNIDLPTSLQFFIDNNLYGHIRSHTDCYFDGGEKIQKTQNPSGHILHLIADSQWCYHWYLFIAENQDYCILGGGDALGYHDEEQKSEVVDIANTDLKMCSQNFLEFIYRFWIENEIWHILVYENHLQTFLTSQMENYIATYCGVTKKKNLEHIEMPKIYEGCTFFLQEEIATLQGCIFKDCSFRDRDITLRKTTAVHFIRCNFNKITLHDYRVKFNGGTIDCLILDGVTNFEPFYGIYNINKLHLYNTEGKPCYKRESHIDKLPPISIQTIIIDSVDTDKLSFAGVKNLQKVQISNSTISDGNIREWNTCGVIQLHFKEIELNDQCISALQEYTTLQELHLQNCPKIPQLDQALPQCKIVRI